MTSSPEEKPVPPPRLGQMVETVVAQLDPADRPPFLAVAEQQARQRGDLELLRAFRDYRKMREEAA